MQLPEELKTLPEILEEEPRIFVRDIRLTSTRLHTGTLAARMKEDARTNEGEHAYKPVLYGIIFDPEGGRLYVFTGRFTQQFEKPLDPWKKKEVDNRPRERQVPFSILPPYECWVMSPLAVDGAVSCIDSLTADHLSRADIEQLLHDAELVCIFPEKPAILEKLGPLIVDTDLPSDTPLPVVPRRPQGYTEQWRSR